MSLQKRIEELQGTINRNVALVSDKDIDTIKDLIHAYNLRGNTLLHIFKQAVHFRRLWRKQHIDPNLLGQMLTFIRKTSYMMIKMRNR